MWWQNKQEGMGSHHAPHLELQKVLSGPLGGDLILELLPLEEALSLLPLSLSIVPAVRASAASSEGQEHLKRGRQRWL